MLRDVVNIIGWLERDRDSTWQERQARDRALALKNPAFARQNKLQRVFFWWRAINGDHAVAGAGADVVRLFYWVSAFVLVAGLIGGGGVAGAVLDYDGSTPINLFSALAWLVLLPICTLFLSLLIPLVQSRGMINSFNLGAIVAAVLKSRLSGAASALTMLGGSAEKYFRWRLMFGSQLFALGYSIGACAVLLFIGTVSDLAFTWGTTLNVGVEPVYAFVRFLSLPWAGLLPDSVPDFSLVVESRHFRLENSANKLSAVNLTKWWQFLLLAVLFYGVLLRSLTLITTGLCLRYAARQLLLNHPQTVALIERLESPEISGQALSEEQLDHRQHDRSETQNEITTQVACVISWHGALPAYNLLPATVISLRNEQQLADYAHELTIAKHSGLPIQVVCKGWEPPLLEFQDLLCAIRERIGQDVAIIVTPVDIQGAPAREHDKAIWRGSLAHLHDPGLTVQ